MCSCEKRKRRKEEKGNISTFFVLNCWLLLPASHMQVPSARSRCMIACHICTLCISKYKSVNFCFCYSCTPSVFVKFVGFFCFLFFCFFLFAYIFAYLHGMSAWQRYACAFVHVCLLFSSFFDIVACSFDIVVLCVCIPA